MNKYTVIATFHGMTEVHHVTGENAETATDTLVNSFAKGSFYALATIDGHLDLNTIHLPEYVNVDMTL